MRRLFDMRIREAYWQADKRVWCFVDEEGKQRDFY